MNNSPLLSIVIPTKDRYKYLFDVVNKIANIESLDFEIIVQDNSKDNQEGVAFFRNIHDNRIKYFHTNDDLSQAGNSDKAILNSSGEFVCFIGDDDCVLPEIIEAVQWMKATNIEVLINSKVKYTWSDLKHKNLGGHFSGMLVCKRYSGKFYYKSTQKELAKCLKSGGQELLELPQLYHNIVKRDTLDKIYSKSGTFFPGPSPDMAVAIALCSFVDNYVKLDYPLVISGKAQGSVGGMGAQGKHIGEIKNISFLPKDTADTWSSKVPFYWSGCTIYADSVLKSLKATSNQYQQFSFSFNSLYAHCLVFDVLYRDEIYNTINQNNESSWLKIILYISKIWLKRLKIFFINRTRIPGIYNITFYPNVKTIGEAVDIMRIQVNGIKKPWCKN